MLNKKQASERLTANLYRTHTTGELTKSNLKQHVRLSGWVHARRDHGGLIFIDLRDRTGLTQLTFNPKQDEASWTIAETLRPEFVINISGTVVARPDNMINGKLTTGEIEIAVEQVTILSKSRPLPFEISSDKPVNEELRLKYRFLDLRRPRSQEILASRDKFIRHIRGYMHRHNFLEVQTPLLANSSPEGARDFLVPSRIHPGQFYALPQAPQQYKQLLMAAGVDRYFQIAPCFRDEDPRADRHPGVFYQLDMEMSFVEQDDIFAIIEPLMIELTEQFSKKTISNKPFLRLPWQTAMSKYGSDKPDLRFDLFITDVSDIVADSNFKVFSQALAEPDLGGSHSQGRGVVHALHVPGAADLSRADLDSLTTRALQSGADGLAYLLLKDKPTSPIVKHLGDKTVSSIIAKLSAATGDAIFFSAGPWLKACQTLGAVRTDVAKKMSLIDDDQAAWCWITDFPLYEFNEQEDKIDFSHNPFSMPQGGLAALQTKDPTAILAYQYDLTLNGFEVSSGAIRNHDPEIMYRAFAIAGYTKQEVDQKFAGLLRAFHFGVPPHGGIAPGIDRLFMVLHDLPSIRDAYAFPKNGRAQDVLMNAPSPVDPARLKDLHLKLDLPDEHS